MCCEDSRVRVLCVWCACIYARDLERRIFFRLIFTRPIWNDPDWILKSWRSRFRLLVPAVWWSLIRFWRFFPQMMTFAIFFLKTACCMIQTVCLWSWICLPTAVSAIQWQREDLRDDSSKIFQNCFVYQSFHVSSLAISKKNDYLCRRSGKSRSFFGILEWSAVSDASVLEQRRDRCC